MESYESPQLVLYGTITELTQGGGEDTPEQSGSTFPIISDERLKRDIRPL